MISEKKLNIDKSTWQLTKLNHLAKEISIRVDNPAKSEFRRFVGLEHFVSGDLKIKNWCTTDNLASGAKAFQKGDILFARRNAYLRRASMADFDGCCSGDAIVLRENHEKLVPGFLAFVMNSSALWDFANSNAAGTMSKRVKWRDLAEYEFLLPPKDQQVKMANLIWNIVDCIEKDNGLLNLSRIIQHSYWNKVKKHSTSIKLKEVAKISTGTTPDTDNKDYWENGTVPWLPTSKVHDKFIVNTDKFVTQKSVKEKKSKIFPKGSTLVAMIGQGKTRGSAAKLLINSAINQNFACVTPIKINDTFLFYSLYFSYHRLRNVSQGSNQLALNCELIENFKIPLPTEDEQLLTSKILIEFEQVIEKLNSRINVAINLQKSLINQVF